MAISVGATQDASYELLDDKDFEDHYMGLSVQIPLGNESAKSRLRQAIYNRRQQLAQATGTLLGAAKVEWEPIVPETSIK